jgi:hypothetical protein
MISTFEVNSIGRCENNSYINMCLILIGYRDRVFECTDKKRCEWRKKGEITYS